MTYFPMGDAETIAFNSTKYPGLCKPMNKTTLDVVYNMQNQVNRIAKVKGLKIMSVDGDIGPGTIAAVKAAAPYLAPMTIDTSSCSAVGNLAVAIAVRAQAVADGLGAPAKVSAPIPAKAPSIITTTGLEIKAPPPAGASLVDSVKNLGMPTLLLFAAGAVGTGYYLTRKPKRGK